MRTEDRRTSGSFKPVKDCLMYFGDICYVMDELIYHGFWGDQHNFEDGVYTVPTFPGTDKHGFFAVAGTAYGDGSYCGNNREYGVDAGVLGLVEGDLWDTTRRDNARTDGFVFEVHAGDTVSFDFSNGIFEFKLYTPQSTDKRHPEVSEYVDTSDEADYEEEEDEEEYDDYNPEDEEED